MLAIVTRPVWPDAAGIGHSVVAGLLVHGLYLGGVFISIDRRLPAGLSALVVALQPVLTSTVANRFLGERVIARQWVGLALGIAGVYLVVMDKTVAGEATALGWAAAVVALIGITLGTLYQKRHGGGIDWRAAFILQYAAAGTLFAIGAFAFESRRIVWTAELVAALAWLVFVLSLGAVWLLYFLIRRTAATRVTSLFYLTPAVTALMAWLMFNERLGLLALVGMGLCLTGVFLVNWRIR
jgi:drug/metabolite transporter (DMT)-like permease